MASNRRQRARRAAVQAIYQWLLNGQSTDDIEKHMPEDSNLQSLDLEYFRQIVKGVAAGHAELDTRIESALDRSVSSVDPVERAVLRVAAFELEEVSEVPWRVVIDEAIEASRLFGSDNGYKLVNRVLDQLAASRREASE